mmetsp:Transcript_1569/g.2916  ORF Transcript_1569/g.2916 Transcript_1569/m.2916 type:complete len:147 (-) Transcript_1569:1013-1453(-)
MLSDLGKLSLLVILTAGCLATMFTSPSTTMHNPNMRVLAPPLGQFCKAPRDSVKQCSKDKEDCIQSEKSLQNCESVVKQAIRHINLGGCPFQIKALTLCEDEWCQNPKSCQEECAGVRESLTLCIRDTILSQFQKNGLKEDGARAL